MNGVDIVNGEVAYDASMFEADRSRLESQAETPVVDEDIMAAFSIVRECRPALCFLGLQGIVFAQYLLWYLSHCLTAPWGHRSV